MVVLRSRVRIVNAGGTEFIRVIPIQIPLLRSNVKSRQQRVNCPRQRKNRFSVLDDVAEPSRTHHCGRRAWCQCCNRAQDLSAAKGDRGSLRAG